MIYCVYIIMFIIKIWIYVLHILFYLFGDVSWLTILTFWGPSPLQFQLPYLIAIAFLNVINIQPRYFVNRVPPTTASFRVSINEEDREFNGGWLIETPSYQLWMQNPATKYPFRIQKQSTFQNCIHSEAMKSGSWGVGLTLKSFVFGLLGLWVSIKGTLLAYY